MTAAAGRSRSHAQKLASGDCRAHVIAVSGDFGPRAVKKMCVFVNMVDRLFKPLHLLIDDGLVDRDVMSVMTTAIVLERRGALAKQMLPRRVLEHMNLYLKTKAKDVIRKLPQLPVCGKPTSVTRR